MRYSRNTKNITFGILALLVSVVAVGLAYAGFSQTLNINGSANVISSKWDIYFANLSSANTTGTANLVTGANIIAKTTIGTYDVEFYTPGDSLTYTFDVTNQGDFDAILYNLTKSAPTCSSSDSNASGNRVCSHLTYTLKYTDNNQDVAEGNTLLVGETKNMTLKLVYNLDTPASALPDVDVVVSSLGITFVYNQNSSYGGNGVSNAYVPPVVNVYSVSSDGQNIGDTLTVNNVNTFNNYSDAITAYSGNPFFTAHVTNGSDEIIESYVGFVLNGQDYYLKGADAVWDANYENLITEAASYDDNVRTLNIAFGEENCNLENENTDDEYYLCEDSVSGLNANAGVNGNVSAYFEDDFDDVFCQVDNVNFIGLSKCIG